MVQLGCYGFGCGQRLLGSLREKQGQEPIGQGAESGTRQGIGHGGVGPGQFGSK
jgi:hypothetical protein